MATPTLVTRDVLAALDAAGVRCEVIDTDRNHTTLRFDHVALDRLADSAEYVRDLRGEVADLRATLAEVRRTLKAAS